MSEFGYEDFDTIASWGVATFAPKKDADPKAVALKMLGEAIELCYAAGVVWSDVSVCSGQAWDKATAKGEFGRDAFAEELADCIIVGCTGLGTTGYDAQVRVDEKMSRNRSRRWNVRPDGTAQHVAGGEA